jgi:hypothetical protein
MELPLSLVVVLVLLPSSLFASAWPCLLLSLFAFAGRGPATLIDALSAGHHPRDDGGLPALGNRYASALLGSLRNTPCL